jgi:hypothetical protein
MNETQYQKIVEWTTRDDKAKINISPAMSNSEFHRLDFIKRHRKYENNDETVWVKSRNAKLLSMKRCFA